MKKKEFTKLREKSVSELENLALEKKAGLGVTKNVRREIAQILTIAREAKLNENTNR